MKKEFVKTENDRAFRAALAQKEQRAARESGLIVVHGRAGDGKTRTLHNWASHERAAMLTGRPSWTVRRMLADLAQQLSIPPKGDWEAAVAEKIAAEQIPVVLDEAGFGLRDNAACLEEMRSIADKAGTLLIAVVMERDMDRLRGFEQLTSRATLCTFKPASRADVTAACAQLCGVEVAPDLVERIWRDSGQRMRLIVEAIQMVEAVALSVGKPLATVADLAGYVLCESFQDQRSARAGRAA